MTGNIIGEEFLPYVINQIQSRQEKYGKGINNELRSFEDINYLSNRNAWIKMASSVDVQESNRVKNINLDPGGKFNGINLAKKAILFSSLTDFVKGGGIDEKNNDIHASYTQRRGVSETTDIWNNSAYGLGGIDFGLQPPPGITSVTINTVNRGSIRKATVNIKAYNKFQFELIELLYLRIGFTMMLEWGWDKYINDKNSNKIEPMGNTLIENWWFTATNSTQLEVLKQIESYRNRYCGNYDGFFGKVSNYRWKFQSDGTYDISLSLITVGDVVESLQARVAATSNFLSGLVPGDASIFTSMGQTVIDQWLYESIQNNIFANGTNYIMYPSDENSVIPSSDYAKYNMDMTSYGVVTYSAEHQKYKYYVTFNELIKRLSELCIPTIKNGTAEAPQLYFDNDIENILIKVFPNQISIDPRVCLFEPYLSKIDFDSMNARMVELKQYVVSKNNIIFGQLMNMYINFDFILTCLRSNVDKNNNLSLYRFLEDICSGINSSLGGVNKIQPIIKDDNIITFIDQALQSSSILNNSKKDTAKIEVYGYNMNDKSSNFVKNIEFQTKLSKETSAMISIGATAGGDETSVKNGDATAFSKWNEGLVDRFCQNITDPLEKLILTPMEMHVEMLTINQSVDLLTLKAKYQNEVIQFLSIEEKNKYDALNWDLITREVTKSLKDPSYKVPSIYKLSDQNIIKYISEKEATMVNNYIENKLPTEEIFTTDVSTGYLAYLLEAFGGIASQKITDDGKITNYGKDIADPQYNKYNPQFIDKGKSLYPSYIAYKARKNYSQTKNHSSQIGFLPLEFTLTTDGISGIKIYNKLNISQHFLPSSYPTSFDFVVTKLDHKIDNMGWDTEIGTLSTSNLDELSDAKANFSSLVVTPQSEGHISRKSDSAQILANKLQIAKSLKQNGLTAAQIAAIMGNIEQESSFEPNALNKKDLNGYASYGLIQWNEKYYPQIYKICAPYRNDNSPASHKTIIDLQIKYLISNTSNYSNFKNSTTKSDVKTAAWVFADKVEICHLCNKGRRIYETSYQNKRTTYALEIYQQLITSSDPLYYNNL